MELPEDLERWVKAGGEVRRSVGDLLPGLCGGLLDRVESRSKMGGGGQYCGQVAGFGTGHRRVGRCYFHEGNYVDGLPPWVGEVSEEDWSRLTGRRGEVVEDVPGRVKRKFEDFIRECLDADDREVFDSVRTDPVLVLDQEMKLNRVQAVKILRFIRHRQMMSEMSEVYVGGRDSEIERAEMALSRISQNLARLLEVRARYTELEDARNRVDDVSEVLKTLSERDFSLLRKDPSSWHKLAGGFSDA